MSKPNETRKKILDDYYAILQSACSQKISEMLTFRNKTYHLPRNIAVNLFQRKNELENQTGPVKTTKETITYLYFLAAITEKTISAISFDETGDQILIDKVQLYKLPIEEKFFEGKIKALTKVKKIINNPVWQKIFVALILSTKKREDFNELTLVNEITFLCRKELEAKKLN